MTTSGTPSQRFLLIYSAVVTAVFAATVIGGITFVLKKPKFREIDVERINLVEPDGTLRMVISDKARFPGWPYKGQNLPHPAGRSETGMLFLDDEGSENGGLIFGGKNDNGRFSSYGHISFDQYESDQVLEIAHFQDGPEHRAEIVLSDRADDSLVEVVHRWQALPPGPEKDALAQKIRGTKRFVIGKDADHAVSIRMKDGKGRDRLVFRVPAEGAPSIEALDESGNAVGSVPNSAR